MQPSCSGRGHAARLGRGSSSSTSFRCPRPSGRPSRAGRRARLTVVDLLKPAEGADVTWSQTTDEVVIRVPVAAGTRGRDVSFEVHPTRLRLAVGGDVLLEGGLSDAGPVNIDECFWVLEEDEQRGGGAGGGRVVAVTLSKAAMGYESWEALLESDRPDTTVTHRVALDVRVGGRAGRLVVGLFGNVVPRTVDNFRRLASAEGVDGPDGRPLRLAGSPFHRVIGGFMAQGGDITAGDGTGGWSVFGESFEDENFKLRHDWRGVLAMANAGPNTNSSQFYITFAPTPHLDGKHVVFGKVLAGWSTLMMVEGAGSDGGAPTSPVLLEACRELGPGEDAQALVEKYDQAQREARAEQAEQAGEAKEAGQQQQGDGAAQAQDAAQQPAAAA